MREKGVKKERRRGGLKPEKEWDKGEEAGLLGKEKA